MKRLRLFLLPLIALACLTATEKPRPAKAQPATDTISVAGLRGRVTVRRDERGMPYIEATNDYDLYFAQGYVTASDRLWQMDLLRRNVRG